LIHDPNGVTGWIDFLPVKSIRSSATCAMAQSRVALCAAQRNFGKLQAELVGLRMLYDPRQDIADGTIVSEFILDVNNLNAALLLEPPLPINLGIPGIQWVAGIRSRPPQWK
jgi:hypothetical protein